VAVVKKFYQYFDTVQPNMLHTLVDSAQIDYDAQVNGKIIEQWQVEELLSLIIQISPKN
jgi:hypothetical protein